MKQPTPTDFRNATFTGLRGKLDGLRRDVYHAWVTHGAMTTRELAQRCGIDLLTLRPRTTELVDLGLVKCVGGANGNGIYQAVSESEWDAWRNEIVGGQMLLI